MSIGFGASASQWIQRMPSDIPIIACEMPYIGQAFFAAVDLRRRNEPFLASLFLEDPRTQAALRMGAPSIVAQFPDYDSRRVAFEALANEQLVSNNVAQRDWVRIDPRLAQVAREFLLCADGVLCRSNVELERLSAVVNRRFAHALIAPCESPAVPQPTVDRGNPDGITVWAPDLTPTEASLFTFAFEETRFPVRVVCGDGPPAPPMRAQVIRHADAAEALRHSLVVVDASLYDPGSAIALARWGIPLATAATSGAHEWLDGVFVYEPWNFRSIYSAAFHALGGGPPAVSDALPDRSGLHAAFRRAVDEPPTRGPLVTVIIPTRNRLDQLPASLASVEAQTYRDIDILVVNDGGEDIEPIVRAYPRARALNLPVHQGLNASLNAGIAAARGDYIALLADDDAYCPDHCARLAAALERTGAMIAHGNEIAVFSERLPDGSYKTIGHSAVSHNAVEPSMLLVGNYIGGPSIMVRRKVFDEVGKFDDRFRHISDFEMWLRISKRFDLIHVDRVVALMSMRTDASQISVISGVETSEIHRTIYEAHPVHGRPNIEQRRAFNLQGIAATPVTRWPLLLRVD